MKTTEFVQSIRKMAFGIDKVTFFGEGIIYRIWVPKNQYDSVKVAMIWQDKNRKIIDPEGYRAIKDYLSALEESDLLGIISDYMATPIDERGLPDSGGRRMSLTDGRYLSFNHGPKFTTIYGDQFTTSDPH